MKTYRAYIERGIIIEGSFRSVYEACVWYAKCDHVASEIYDSGEYWERHCLPHARICIFEKTGVLVFSKTGKSIWYDFAKDEDR